MYQMVHKKYITAAGATDHPSRRHRAALPLISLTVFSTNASDLFICRLSTRRRLLAAGAAAVEVVVLEVVLQQATHHVLVHITLDVS